MIKYNNEEYKKWMQFMIKTNTTQNCNEQKAKDIALKYLSLVQNHDIEGAVGLLATQFTWTGLSMQTNRNSVKDILALEISNSNKYFFHKDKINFQRLCDNLCLLLLPITIHRKNSSSLNIVSTVIVDIKIEKIVSITFPIENEETIREDYTVGKIFFYLDDNLTIKKMDDQVSYFFSFLDVNEFTKYFDNSLINAIKSDEKKEFVELLNNNKVNCSKFTTYLSLMNKIGEFIEVIFDMSIIKTETSKFEISAVLHDSMNLDDLRLFNTQRFSRLTNILNNSPTPFFYKNIERKYLSLNNAFLKLLKVKDYYDVVGKTDYNFLSKRDADIYKAEDDEVVNNKQIITGYSKFEKEDGRINYYQYTKSPMIEKEKVIGLLCFMTDISDVKNLNNQLIKSQSELDYIFKNSNIAYFLKDTNLRFQQVNKCFLRYNSFISNIIGKTNEELFPPSFDLLGFKDQEKEILKTKKPFTVSQIKTGKTGKKYYYSIIESPLFDDNNNVIGIVGSIEDITVSVERQIRLEEKYQHTIKLISDENFLAFVRIDLKNFYIVEYQSVNDIGFKGSLKLNDNIMQVFTYKMLYESEKEEAKKIFNYDYLNSSFSPEGKFNCEYTFSPNKKRISVANIEVTYNINPSNNHHEVFIYAIDVTKRYQLNELVKSITKIGYDFIVKANILIDSCEFLIFNKDLYPFEKNQNIFSIEEFLEILFKSNKEKQPSKDYCINLIKNKLIDSDEFKYSFETLELRRKSLIVRLLDKEKQTYLLSLTDITDITKKDQILQEKLKKSVIESEKANKIKADFLARMSHDMRTPLNGIMGLANLGLKESLDDKISDYFSKIKISGKYLSTLLNDVLDMQSIEKGKIIIFPKPIITKEFIKEIEQLVISFARAKKIEFKVVLPLSGPSYLFDDSVRISQILVNLLNNAIKYTASGGHITNKTEFLGGEKNFYKITISDDGVGMSREFQKHMFESFTTETNKYSSIEGSTGLGLAITKNLVSLLGGKIECKSTLNVGTTFIVHIPTHPISEEEYLKIIASKNLINLEKLKGKKILICEDNKINTMILEKLLLEKGLIVDTAENGKIGLEKTKTNKYDAILMDIKMSVMDGLTSASLIRKNDKRIPIIALSANAYKEDVDKSLASGMNAHLSKPIDRNELFTTLSQFIK